MSNLIDRFLNQEMMKYGSCPRAVFSHILLPLFLCLFFLEVLVINASRMTLGIIQIG